MKLINPVDFAIPIFAALILADIVIAYVRDRSRYCPRDMMTSLFLGLGSLIVGICTSPMVYATASWLYKFHIFTIDYHWYWFLIAFVVDDFLFYICHRSAHRVRWFWASHIVHHSSQHYNLSTAIRQTWTGFFSLAFLFRIPLCLIGFPPEMVLFVGALNLVSQFWVHTEAIGRMPRWFEAVMNTPSHHRVHHATNPRYLDRNYGGVFIVWDRLFGTFERERDDDRPRYGIVSNLGSFNVFWAATHEWINIAREVWAAPTWSARLNYMIRVPGWSPDGSRETSEMLRANWRSRQERKERPTLPERHGRTNGAEARGG